MRIVSVPVLFLFLIACQTQLDVPKIDDAYLSDFEQYEESRQEERDYYLKLCGLTKLPDLTSSIGNDTLADVQVPVEGTPELIGYFVNQGDGITFIAADSKLVKFKRILVGI